MLGLVTRHKESTEESEMETGREGEAPVEVNDGRPTRLNLFWGRFTRRCPVKM